MLGSEIDVLGTAVRIERAKKKKSVKQFCFGVAFACGLLPNVVALPTLPSMIYRELLVSAYLNT
jgi:hypothetical protein